MKKGFTIIELLVASLLLGMLVTILTMIFNQSSIAWRTGVAGLADLDDARNNIAIVREEADNVFISDGEPHRLLSPWRDDGSLRSRACDAAYASERPTRITGLNDSTKAGDLGPITIGSGKQTGASRVNYIVNVMSAGPDKEFDTWDDIWSWPDEFE